MHHNTHETITATQLARNLAVAIDQVRISGKPLYITKGSQTIAELSPPPKVGFPMAKLAALLKALPKLEGDLSKMAVDIKKIKRSSRLPQSPWHS